MVSNIPQEMVVEAAGRDWTRKGDTSNPQLSGKFVINDAGIGPGVDEVEQDMGNHLAWNIGLVSHALITGQPWLLMDSQSRSGPAGHSTGRICP